MEWGGVEWSMVELLVFSVTPFKIDQNKNQNRSIDKVQNLRKQRRYVCKDSRQDSGSQQFFFCKICEETFYQNL